MAEDTINQEQSLPTSHPSHERRSYDRELAELKFRVAAIELSVASILEIVSAARGAFKVLEIVGRLAKPLIYIGTVASALTYYLKTGRTLP